jgi:hypothetical protein
MTEPKPDAILGPWALVSDAEDAGVYAKRTWFSGFDRCLLCTFGTAGSVQKYSGVFKKFTYTSDSPVSHIIGVHGKKKNAVVILLDPPTHSEMLDGVLACMDLGCPVLCHFTAVNACFDPLPDVIKECVYDAHDTESLAVLKQRWFKFGNQPHPCPSHVALSKTTGLYLINLDAQTPEIYAQAESCVLRHLLNKSFRKPENALSLLMTKLYLEEALVFTPVAKPFLNTWLPYNPKVCPDLLVPKCAHILVDPTLEAVETLVHRITNNALLQTTSLFVCITCLPIEAIKKSFTYLVNYGHTALFSVKTILPTALDVVADNKIGRHFVADVQRADPSDVGIANEPGQTAFLEASDVPPIKTVAELEKPEPIQDDAIPANLETAIVTGIEAEGIVCVALTRASKIMCDVSYFVGDGFIVHLPTLNLMNIINRGSCVMTRMVWIVVGKFVKPHFGTDEIEHLTQAVDVLETLFKLVTEGEARDSTIINVVTSVQNVLKAASRVVAMVDDCLEVSELSKCLEAELSKFIELTSVKAASSPKSIDDRCHQIALRVLDKSEDANQNRSDVAKADDIAKEPAAKADDIAKAEVAKADDIAKEPAAKLDDIAKAEVAKADDIAKETAIAKNHTKKCDDDLLLFTAQKTMHELYQFADDHCDRSLVPEKNVPAIERGVMAGLVNNLIESMKRASETVSGLILFTDFTGFDMRNSDCLVADNRAMKAIMNDPKEREKTPEDTAIVEAKKADRDFSLVLQAARVMARTMWTINDGVVVRNNQIRDVYDDLVGRVNTLQLLINYAATGVSLSETTKEAGLCPSSGAKQTTGLVRDKTENVLCVIKERTIVATMETTLRFRIFRTMAVGECFKLEAGFPVQGQYALFFDGQWICDSCVEEGVVTFKLPERDASYLPCWAHIEMTNATNKQYVYSAKRNQFYFSQYKISLFCAAVGTLQVWTIIPRSRFRVMVNPTSTLMLKVHHDGEFFFLCDFAPGMTVTTHVVSFLEGDLSYKKKFMMPFNAGAATPALFVFWNPDTHFFPATIQVTETYTE